MVYIPILYGIKHLVLWFSLKILNSLPCGGWYPSGLVDCRDISVGVPVDVPVAVAVVVVDVFHV